MAVYRLDCRPGLRKRTLMHMPKLPKKKITHASVGWGEKPEEDPTVDPTGGTSVPVSIFEAVVGKKNSSRVLPYDHDDVDAASIEDHLETHISSLAKPLPFTTRAPPPVDVVPTSFSNTSIIAPAEPNTIAAVFIFVNTSILSKIQFITNAITGYNGWKAEPTMAPWGNT